MSSKSPFRIYLQAGETYFPRIKQKVKSETGKVILFKNVDDRGVEIPVNSYRVACQKWLQMGCNIVGRLQTQCRTIEVSRILQK
jgi:uncharacterized membrane-anchored protein